MLTPSFSSTSAAPDLDETARLPCLATGTPAAGEHEGRGGRDVEGALGVAAGADDIDGAFRRLTATIRLFIAATAPAISSAVSPRAFSATRKAASWISDTPPCMMQRNASRASSSESAAPEAAFSK